MTSTSKISIGGIILCGGKSSRMGQPKLSLPFGPESMLARMVRILQEVVSPIVVVAAAGQDLPDLPEKVLVARDEHPECGPLEGLAVGLSVLDSQVDAAYVTSCDAPLLKPSFVRAMIDSLATHDLAIPRDGKYHHPLAGVYRTPLHETARALIAADRMRPRFLVDECDACLVDVEALRSIDPDLQSLHNTNTDAEYLRALETAGFSNRG